MHHVAHGGGHGNLHGLGQHHVTHTCGVRQRQGLGGFPLAAWNSLDTTTPDLAQKRRAVQDERDARSDPRVDVHADHGRAKEDQEQLQQQRCALEDLREDHRHTLQPAHTTRAGQRHGQAEHGTADKRDQRQRECPLRRTQDKKKVGPTKGTHGAISGQGS